MSARGPAGEHGPRAGRRARPRTPRAADGRGAAAGSAGADRAALPLQHAGDRAAPVPHHAAGGGGHARQPDALPQRRAAADARGDLDARARGRPRRGLPRRAEAAHGPAPELRHRRPACAARGAPAADDAADPGRERHQARPLAAARGRASSASAPPRSRAHCACGSPTPAGGFVRSSGGGTGLANLRARLSALRGGPGRLDLALNEPRGITATITLPHAAARAAAPRP